MIETNKDFESIMRCLTIDPKGIVYLPEDKTYLEFLLTFFPTLQPAKKRPDAYSIKDDTVLLLEHFEFDNSKTTRKGSEQNIKDAKIQRALDNNLTLSTMISERVEKTGPYYVKSLEEVFLSHANNIGNYKKEINAEMGIVFNNYITGFVIEDASSFGSSYYDQTNGAYTRVNMLYAKEFLDLFEKTPQLDFVIFAITKSNYQNNGIFFISRNTIEEYRKKQIEVSKIKRFLFEDEIYMGVTVLLPLKKQ